MEGLWQKAADRMRDTLDQVGFETWIGPLNFLGMQGRSATIEAPNRFFRAWVSDPLSGASKRVALGRSRPDGFARASRSTTSMALGTALRWTGKGAESSD